MPSISSTGAGTPGAEGNFDVTGGTVDYTVSGTSGGCKVNAQQSFALAAGFQGLTVSRATANPGRPYTYIPGIAMPLPGFIAATKFDCTNPADEGTTALVMLGPVVTTDGTSKPSADGLAYDDSYALTSDAVRSYTWSLRGRE